MERFFVISREGGFQLPDGPCVLPAEQCAQLVAANALLRRAEEEAAAIREEARLAYEAERIRGYEDGMRDGKMEMAERMLDSMVESVNYLESMEVSSVDLVMSALGKLLEEIPERQRVVNMVKKALSYVRNQKKVVLRVCPQDAELVRQSMAEVLRSSPSVGMIDVFPDNRLTAGACVLESELGLIDAGLETQMGNIRRAFSKALSRRGD